MCFLRLVLAALMLATGTTARAESIGIVLMHGKQGTPGQFERMADALETAGFLTERPEMCWSRQRIYDLAYLDCFRDVDLAIARLKERGATAIVVGGQSLGGNGALGYGARHPGLKGIIAMAPAHAPQFIALRPDIAPSLARAQATIAAGKGDQKEIFSDLNTGPGTSTYTFDVTTTAKIYVSFFAPDSPAVMGPNAAKLSAPLLMISGNNDPTQRNAARLFALVPQDPRNRQVSVEADHLGTPAAARAAIASWLGEIATK
jgi:esterase/lipase